MDCRYLRLAQISALRRTIQSTIVIAFVGSNLEVSREKRSSIQSSDDQMQTVSERKVQHCAKPECGTAQLKTRDFCTLQAPSFRNN